MCFGIQQTREIKDVLADFSVCFFSFHFEIKRAARLASCLMKVNRYPLQIKSDHVIL